MIVGSQMVASTKTLKFMSAGVFRNKRNYCSRKHKLSYFDDVQRLRNKHQRDYRPNDTIFHENLAIHLSNSCKKAALQMHVLDAQNLNAWTLGLLTLGLCKLGRLVSGRIDSTSLDAWTLGLRTTGLLHSGRLESGRLQVRALDACALDACTFGFWTPGRLYFGCLDAQLAD